MPDVNKRVNVSKYMILKYIEIQVFKCCGFKYF